MYIAESLAKDNKEEVVQEMEYDKEMLRKIANGFSVINRHGVIMLHNKSGYALAIAGIDSEVSALEYLTAYATANGWLFKGGGSKRIAEGKLAKA